MFVHAAVDLRSPGDPNWHYSLNNLSFYLYIRYLEQKMVADLDEAITHARAVLDLQPPGHPDRSSSLHFLGIFFNSRFCKDSRMEDLDEAIMFVRAAIDLRPPGDPDRHYSLSDLASYLHNRYLKENRPADLDEAIMHAQAALDFRSPGHPERSSSLHSLATLLGNRFRKDSQMEDLEDAIMFVCAAIDLRPAGDPNRHHSLYNLSSYLYCRYHEENQIADLDEAITQARAALDLRPPAHPDRSLSLHSLGIFLNSRFCNDSRIEDLDEAITLVRAAVDLRPPDDPNRHYSLYNLSFYLHSRYLEQKKAADLDEAITHARAALDIRGHSGRPESSRGLAILLRGRSDKYILTENLEEVITFFHTGTDLLALAPDCCLLINKLLICLRKRYSRDKAVADLEEMIMLKRAMLELQPTEHPERPSSVISLENDIVEMMDKSRTEVDLDKAITLGREMVALHLPGGPRRPGPLRKLIKCFEERFQKCGAVADLDELIIHHRVLLELHPSGNLERPSLLHDLAHYLWRKFQGRGEICNLEEAIALERIALDLRQQRHADRAESIYTLVRYLGEYSEVGNVLHLGELIALGGAILEHGQLEHPNHVSSLRKLALLVSDRFRPQAGAADTDVVIELTVSALKICSPGPLDRPALLRTFAACRRERLRGAKPDPEGIKKRIRDAVHDTLETLPTRLLNTLTGHLCGRDALISDFEDSTQCKQLLASAANSDPLHNEHIREIVSAYFRYVNLSHRWGSDEPLLRDVQGRVIYDMGFTDGITKLQSFCAVAGERGCMWAWSDTCCIDKESSAELQEAIGSMFGWYRRSALTIVHLADVSDHGALSNSVWFERGWTLQELLAPHSILFFTQDWSLYGDRVSTHHKEDTAVLAELAKVTNIPSHYLTEFHPGTGDARSRLQWASARRTTRPEDMAYSLFGVFNLHLPVLYGESKENSLGRLLAEIISQSGDISVLDWVGEASPFHSCFPAHISAYQTPYLFSLADQIRPSTLTHTHEQIAEALHALFHSLSMFDPPQWIGRRLKLPCITHRVTTIQQKGILERTGQYVYHIQAEGLAPLKIVTMDEFKNFSRTGFPYVLVRPWHAKLLGPSADTDGLASEKLAMMLGQPFSALLLEELPQNEYRRIASSFVIVARPADAASIHRSNVQTLDIV